MRMLILAAASLLAAGSTVSAGNHAAFGTPGAYPPSPPKLGQPFTVKPAKTYKSAAYATGGVALRNRTEGVINISGVVPPVQAAWLYFGYLFQNAPPANLAIKLTRYYPAPTANQTVKAKLIGTSLDPCWGAAGGAIYKASVPVTFALDNGEYRITVPASVAGLGTGEDPWLGNLIYPLDEGASLVLIGAGGSTVDLFDTTFAGHEFGPASLSYTLFLSSPAGPVVFWDTIGADGQSGASRLDILSTTSEVTKINGTQVSGPGSSFFNDSDWNGGSGLPVPQLWDDNGHDISIEAPSGTTSLNIDVDAPNDCLITVANVVSH